LRLALVFPNRQASRLRSQLRDACAPSFSQSKSAPGFFAAIILTDMEKQSGLIARLRLIQQNV